MYESLMFLAWGVTAVTLYFAATEGSQAVTAERSEKQAITSDIAAVWSSPVAWGIVAFATLSLPKELQRASALVPALQSNWLVMHVSVVMLSYATLMFGSVLCMAVLALSQPKDSPITAFREAVVPALRGIAGGLAPQQQQPQVATSPQVPEMAVSSMSNTLEAPSTAQGSTAQQFQVAGGSGGAVTVEFSSASAAPAAQLSEDDKLAITLDDLAYRSLLLGFGFLTIGIVSGAVWANEAWGNYWSWDPKETWALICWLVYAGYLHVRLQLGWDTRDSAKIGAFGFFIVWLCYVGVNLMGVGLHSYGFFLK
jgi:cytochrome c-type biogenesis protein CcsB